MANILVFGASIAYGFADSNSGWVQRLRTFLENDYFNNKKEWFEVYNLGISGDTTEDLSKRIKTDAEPRSEPNTITLISIGVNDSAKWTEKKGNWVSPENYRKNLIAIVKKAQVFSKQVILIGITPVDESKTKPPPWAPHISYLKNNIEEYNQIMGAVALEFKTPFINLIPELKKIGWNKMLKDGVHPNDEGHQKIFELVKKELEEKRII